MNAGPQAFPASIGFKNVRAASLGCVLIPGPER